MALSNIGLINRSVSTGVAKTASAGAGGGFSFGAKAIIGGATLAMQLAEISSQKKQVAREAAFDRKVVIGNAKRDNDITELAAFRLLKTQTAQASSGGFSGKSGSTLAIKAQTENDKDRVLINRNEVLANQLTAINAQERAARKSLKFAKVKAVTGFATSLLG